MFRSSWKRRTAIPAVAALLVLVTSRTASAQGTWDVAAVGGLFVAHAPVAPDRQSYQDWFRTGVAGVAFGRYLTTNLKLEVEAGGTGVGRQFVQQFVTVPGYNGPYPIGAEAETSTRSLSAVTAWQFFENQWVHPFLAAGVAADFERSSVRVWEQHYYTGDLRAPVSRLVIAPESRSGPETTLVVRGVVGGGAKLYVAERAFIRPDAQISLGTGKQHIAFRIGAGIDF